MSYEYMSGMGAAGPRVGKPATSTIRWSNNSNAVVHFTLYQVVGGRRVKAPGTGGWFGPRTSGTFTVPNGQYEVDVQAKASRRTINARGGTHTIRVDAHRA